MRLYVLVGSMVLLLACVGPHGAAGLWSLRSVELESQATRGSDALRANPGRAIDLGLADEVLASERARINEALESCPSPERQAFGLSVGDRARDMVRIKAADEPARLFDLAAIALADWRVRRAAAAGQRSMCDAAREALAGAAAHSFAEPRDRVRPAGAAPIEA